MNNTTTSELEKKLLLLNQLELVAPTTVSGTLYGIALCLFCLYVHALVPRLQGQDRKRSAKFMLVYSSVIMLCGLYNLVANAWITQDAYIKHESYPGGPFVYITTTFRTPVLIISSVCQVVGSILTSSIQIWRLWVIWRATRYANLVIVIPSLCFLTFTGLRLRTITLEATLPFTKAVQVDSLAATADIALQGAVTLLCTILISLFLIFQHWRQRKLIDKFSRPASYINVVAMLIESYALESIWILLVASLGTITVVGAFFTETVTHIEILAYLLIQYRVARGTAYGSQGEPEGRMSSLHWNRSNRVTTQSETTSDACGDSHGSSKAGISDVLPGSSMA